MRKIFAWLLTLSLILAVLPAALAQEDAFERTHFSIVANPRLTDRLNLREKPDENAKSLGRLYSGTPVLVDENGAKTDGRGRVWERVSLDLFLSGDVDFKGYMLKEYLKPLGENAVPPAFFYASVRSGAKLLREPRNNAAVTATAGDGNLSVLGDIGDDWRLVMNGSGRIGFVRAARLIRTWVDIQSAFARPTDGGDTVTVYSDIDLKKPLGTLYAGAPLHVYGLSKGKGTATVESFGVEYALKEQWQADLIGYVRAQDVDAYSRPWEVTSHMPVGIASKEIATDHPAIYIPQGASITVVGEMKGKYQTVYGCPLAGTWYTEQMAPKEDIRLTSRRADNWGPAALGLAWIQSEGEDEYPSVFLADNPGDVRGTENDAFFSHQLAEIIGAVERDGVDYWQLRSMDHANFYLPKSQCLPLLYADNESRSPQKGPGSWTAEQKEQGFWLLTVKKGKKAVLTLKSPSGKTETYAAENEPQDSTFSFYVQPGMAVTLTGEGTLRPMTRESAPVLIAPENQEIVQEKVIFSGSGRFFCDWQLPNTNAFGIVIRPMEGSLDSFAAVTEVFESSLRAGQSECAEKRCFFDGSPTQEELERYGTVTYGEMEIGDLFGPILLPGYFIEVHHCEIVIFFGNG